MEFMVKGELAKHVFKLAKKDPLVAQDMAKEFLGTIDIEALGPYLLPPNVALELLVKRLQHDPVQTFQDLQQLAQTGTVKRRGRKPGRKPGQQAAVKPVGKKAPKAKPRKKAGSRSRLSAEELARKKEQILKLLKKISWASRAQIMETAGLATQANYTRVMSEMKEEGLVISVGEKSKTIYGLTGTVPPPEEELVPASIRLGKIKKAKPKKAKKARTKKAGTKKAGTKKARTKKARTKKARTKKAG